jgi:leucyl aminopeptidase (aminopeptidase T)
MAYEIGAEHVQVTLEDPVYSRIRVDHSAEAGFLDYTPGYTGCMYHHIVEEGWRSMAVRGPADPDLMLGADAGRLGRMNKSASMARRSFLSAI